MAKPVHFNPSRPPEFLALAAEFLRFGTVGTVGFAVDTATVYATRGALGLYGAGMVAYVAAASVNWALNRVWTFRGRGRGKVHRQWASYLGTNLAGVVLNRGAYALAIALSATARRYPVLAVAVGAMAGMGVNFQLARRVVFR